MNDCPGLPWQAGQNPAYRPARELFFQSVPIFFVFFACLKVTFSPGLMNDQINAFLATKPFIAILTLSENCLPVNALQLLSLSLAVLSMLNIY